ncbi:hypothetical protein D3C72_344400 [compost metagenome]
MKKQTKDAVDQFLKNLDMIRSESKVNPDETAKQQEEAIKRAQKDVDYCVQRYFPHYATSDCAAFQLGFSNRVLKEPVIKAFAQWGRGLAKSVWCDVIIPFWLWINDQAHYMVLIGQNFDKAKQLLGDLQAEFEANPQIIKDFGEQKISGSWEDGKFRTKGCRKWKLKGFIGAALGMGMEVRGLRIGSQRPDLCVCDDLETKELVENPKRQNKIVNWILTALLPTMDGAIRRFLYANNRFATRMIQTELQKKRPKWYISHVPAYDKATLKPTWHQKYPRFHYKELIDELGIIPVEQEYLQEPVIEGKIFTPEQIIWDDIPRLDSFKIITGHWDIAYAGNSTSDYNAVRIWALDKGKLFWYIQGFVKQTKMRAAVEYMCQVQKSLPKSVIIHWRYESQFWNDEVQRTIEEVCEEQGVTLLLTKVDTPRTRKFDRMLTMQPRYQNNRIRYNRKMQADNDTQTGLAQLYALEPGYNTHDDAPDADEQAIAFLEKHITIGKSSGQYRSGKMTANNEAI